MEGKTWSLTASEMEKKTGKRVTASIATLGCKVNQCESAGIEEMLVEQGVEVVPFTERADIYIVNTCTVTARTDYQSRQLISRAARKNPDAVIIVTGCYAQRAPGQLASLSGVSYVIGNEEKKLIPRLAIDTGERMKIHVGDIRREKEISPLGASVFPGHTRAFLKIQDGCDSFCSYCIIPYTRGKSRSLPPGEIRARLSSLAENGYREVVLTGIHTGLWGQDLTPPSSLTSLIKEITESRLVQRLRLSSLQPDEITDDIMKLMQESDILCPHLHLSLQSGCDRILGLMRRTYSTAFFRGLVQRLGDSIPDIALGIDVIAGFPGETQAEFDRTRQFIEEIPIAYLHAFPFSSRPGTSAAKMEGQVSEPEKKRRVQILRAIGTKKRREFAERFLGKPLKVLVEGKKDKTRGLPAGFSGNYIPVSVQGKEVESNSIVTVIPEQADGERLIARVMEAEK